MSSDPRKPDEQDFEQELEAFLRGEDSSSRAYADTKNTQPPADLDAAVLKLAHTAARSRRAQSRLRRWQRPLALAAVLTLSLGVLLQLWKEPQVRNPVVAEETASSKTDAADEAAALPRAPAEPLARAVTEGETEGSRTAGADAETSTRKRAASIAKPQPEQAAPPPPPAAAAAKAAPPSIAMESAPSVMSAPVAGLAQPQAKSDSGPQPAPTMGASAMESMADSPADIARREDAAAKRSQAIESESVQRSFAPRKEMARAAAATQSVESKKREEQAGAWRAPVFDSLQLGSATRADVHQRYGEPASQGLSSPESRNPDRRELLYDFYERLPGHSGVFEFYYERQSLRLLSIRRVLKPAASAKNLATELGWKEAPVVRDWQHPPCESAEATASRSDAQQAPSYWLYPMRGAYLYLSTAELAEQLIYEAECD